MAQIVAVAFLQAGSSGQKRAHDRLDTSPLLFKRMQQVRATE